MMPMVTTPFWIHVWYIYLPQKMGQVSIGDKDLRDAGLVLYEINLRLGHSSAGSLLFK